MAEHVATQDNAPRVLMVSAEVDPFARTGGLGDAVGGLSVALADAGADVLVVTPRYGVTHLPGGQWTTSWWAETVLARVGWGPLDVRELGVLEVREGRPTRGRLRYCLLDHPDLFARDGIYGDAYGTFEDNALRFVVMSRGALEVATKVWPGTNGVRAGPDVLHAHDWHAAPAVISARLTMGPAWRRTPSIFTIHNLAFQGVIGVSELDRLALPRGSFDEGTLAHEGHVNLLHGAISTADIVTTVSPTYAKEIQTRREGCGLDALLRRRAGSLVGILNGIDARLWDPEHDDAIHQRYGPPSVLEGKRANRSALAREIGLDDDETPLFGSVSRLTWQKGIDVLLETVPALVRAGGRVALVGAGEPHLEEGLHSVAARYPGRVASRIAFDAGLSRRIHAGADFFVVPSRYEPCGLTQLYAMRYGAIPIVTSVGGLRDTVTPISAIGGTGTGFLAAAPDSHALLIACEDALVLYADRESHFGAMKRAMARDGSWAAPAQAYLDLYQRARKGRQ